MINSKSFDDMIDELRAKFPKDSIELNDSNGKHFFSELVIRQRFDTVLCRNYRFDVKEPQITVIHGIDYIILTVYLYILDDEGNTVMREVGLASERITLIEDKIGGCGKVPMNVNNSLKIALASAKKDAMINVIGVNAKPTTYGFNYSNKKEKKNKKKNSGSNNSNVIVKKRVELISLFKPNDSMYRAKARDVKSKEEIELLVWKDNKLDPDKVMKFVTKSKIEIPFNIGVLETTFHMKKQYQVAKFYTKGDEK